MFFTVYIALLALGANKAAAADVSAQDAVYFLPGLYSGLTNQRYSFYHAVLLAVERRWTLALPAWKFGYNDYIDGKTLPFSYFYEFDNQILASSKHLRDFRYVSDLPHDRLAPCLTQLQCTSFNDCKYPTLPVMDGRAKAQKVVCLDADSSYYTLLGIARGMYKSGTVYDLPILYELRNAMVIRPMFAEIAHTVIRRLDKTFNTKEFVSVHLRTESDFHKLCTQAKREQWRDSKEPKACYEGEDSIFESLLHEKVPFGSILMVMNGAQTEYFSGLKKLCGEGECHITHHNTTAGVVKLPEHCKSFICVRKENFWTASDAPAEFLQHEMSLAMVDFALANKANLFLGNMYSTMSKELYYTFVGAGRKAVMYNRPCSAFQGNCP